MKGKIKVSNTRTYATRQYENIKPSMEMELEFDVKDDAEFRKILEYAKKKVEDYLDDYNPRKKEEIDDSVLPFN